MHKCSCAPIQLHIRTLCSAFLQNWQQLPVSSPNLPRELEDIDLCTYNDSERHKQTDGATHAHLQTRVPTSLTTIHRVEDLKHSERIAAYVDVLMFMFCRLAMMKEFLFMSGLEEPSYTHPGWAPHTHSRLPEQGTSLTTADLLSCLSTVAENRYLIELAPLLALDGRWWCTVVVDVSLCLWFVTLILCEHIFSWTVIRDHVKGFYCSSALWLWSLSLSYLLGLILPFFPFFFVVMGIMMWFIHVGVPMPRSLQSLHFLSLKTCIACHQHMGQWQKAHKYVFLKIV